MQKGMLCKLTLFLETVFLTLTREHQLAHISYVLINKVQNKYQVIYFSLENLKTNVTRKKNHLSLVYIGFRFQL